MGAHGVGTRLGAAVGGFALFALLAAVLVTLAAPVPGAAAATKSDANRYSLVHGCFALRPASGGNYVAQDANGYAATASGKGGAEPFRMQATDLGRYLFYGEDEDFMARSGDAVVTANAPSDQADWTVTGGRDAFRIAIEAAGRELALDGGGRLVSVPVGQGQNFSFVAREGCAKYPEVALNVKGKPTTSTPRYGEVKGLLEGHMHQMAFEFLGGEAHCGRPWHRFGAPYALRDCADHEIANGCAAILENVLYGNPARCHDPVGWPTFKDWPHPKSLTHESSYYRWLERAWRGGLRVFVNLMVENRTLCEIYPFRKQGYNCNEMDTVLRELKRMRELEDYIDAQSGGPGEGWYRIVRNPFESRKVISQGKLAVVQGMEVSEPFDCRLTLLNRPAQICTPQHISSWLERLKKLGIRQLEIINKTDNALGGVAGDSDVFGVATSLAQLLSSGSFWDLGPCEDPHNHDRSPPTNVLPHNDDLIIANGLRALLPVTLLPVYPEGPVCNQRGLSTLGKHAIEEIMNQDMIFDPDHLSVLARNQSLDLVEKHDYPGMFSSHSWSTPNATPRIYELGGVITPSAGTTTSFAHKWEHLRSERKKNDQYFGVGYGADANGFATQGVAREGAAGNPLNYPFKSFDGKVTIDRQVSGRRTFDLNTDGVAHYGMYPDWVEDLRVVAGDAIVRDMSRGAEAYLQMWERAYGVPERTCRGWQKRKLGGRGIGKLRLGTKHGRVLKRVGQPHRRTMDWSWCAGKGKDVVAGFGNGGHVAFVLSDVRRHRALGVAPGARAKRLPGASRSIGRGVWMARKGSKRFVYVVRGPHISHVGVAGANIGSRPGELAKRARRAAR